MQTENSELSDQVLIADVLNGDRESFAMIVRRYRDMVYGFAFKVCRNKEKAEDTLQDTFINVYRKLNQFDGRSKFSTWIYSIVVNNCLMKNRQSKIYESAISLDINEEPNKPVQPWNSTPLDELLTQELKIVLDEAILKLPLEYRIAFILRDMEGLSAEEAASVLHISVPALKSRLHRARVFLRERLNPYMTS